MYAENEVKLSGQIIKIYPVVTTPAGVKIARFTLEHNSKQIEGEIVRQVSCKIFCVYVDGEISSDLLNNHISVIGFLSTNAQKELVLHITKIKNLD